MKAADAKHSMLLNGLTGKAGQETVAPSPSQEAIDGALVEFALFARRSPGKMIGAPGGDDDGARAGRPGR